MSFSSRSVNVFESVDNLAFELNQIVTTFLSSPSLNLLEPLSQVTKLFPDEWQINKINLYKCKIEELTAKSVFIYHYPDEISSKEQENKALVDFFDKAEAKTIHDSWFYYTKLSIEQASTLIGSVNETAMLLYYLDPYETGWYLSISGTTDINEITSQELRSLSLVFHHLVNIVHFAENKYLTKMGRSFYDRVIAQSNKAVFIHENGIILDANLSSVKLLRANNVNQLKYQHLREFVDESYRELLTNRIENLHSRGKDSPPLYYKLKTLDGKTIDVLMSGLSIEYKGRAVTVSIVDQVTDVQKMNQVQANLSNNFLDFTKNSGDAIFACDSQFKLVEVNPAFTSLFGNDVANLKSIFVNTNDALELFTLMRKNQINKFESLLKTKDGIHLDCILSTNSWNYGKNESGYQGIVRINSNSNDIVKSMGRERLRIMSEISSGIAHEFNNILMAIQGFVENAIYEPFEQGNMDYELSNILQVTERASNLAKSLLIFSGKAHFEKENVEINSLLDYLQPILKVSYENIKLTVTHYDTELYSMMEKNQIHQMMLNIIGLLNDVHSPNQKVVHIRPDLETINLQTQHRMFLEQDLKVGMYNTIEVRHNIPNLTKEKAEEMFTPFFSIRLEDTKLGLSTSFGILHSHGGGLEIQSENNMCTGLKLYLPISKMRSSQRDDISETAAKEVDSERLILLCDDERALLAVTGRMLERMGLTVLTAEDGYHAVEIFKMNHEFIQLVILDMTMPKMSGKETLAEMQKINADIPILISSGYSEYDISEEFSDSKISGILVKPYRFDDLKKKIENILHVNFA